MANMRLVDSARVRSRLEEATGEDRLAVAFPVEVLGGSATAPLNVRSGRKSGQSSRQAERLRRPRPAESPVARPAGGSP